MRRWWVAIALLLLFAGAAAAQDTGSSFGGGDFSGGSDFGGGGGGGGSYDTGSSYDYGSSSSSGGGWSSEAGDCGGVGPLIALLLVAIMVVVIVNASNKGGQRLRRVADEVDDEIDVSAVSLGIDWRARRELQARFAELAASGDVATREGRVRLLRETCLLVRRAEQSWLYAAVTNHSLASRETAEASFRHAAADARARYKKELVRGDEAGVRRTDAGEQTARREGDGVVVVTLVVAARREIVDVDDARDAGALRQLLSILSSMVSHQLAALEVIWSPAAENDRMSTAELETLYPELVKIDERSIAGPSGSCSPARVGISGLKTSLKPVSTTSQPMIRSVSAKKADRVASTAGPDAPRASRCSGPTSSTAAAASPNRPVPMMLAVDASSF